MSIAVMQYLMIAMTQLEGKDIIMKSCWLIHISRSQLLLSLPMTVLPSTTSSQCIVVLKIFFFSGTSVMDVKQIMYAYEVLKRYYY